MSCQDSTTEAVKSVFVSLKYFNDEENVCSEPNHKNGVVKSYPSSMSLSDIRAEIMKEVDFNGGQFSCFLYLHKGDF